MWGKIKKKTSKITKYTFKKYTSNFALGFINSQAKNTKNF